MKRIVAIFHTNLFYLKKEVKIIILDLIRICSCYWFVNLFVLILCVTLILAHFLKFATHFKQSKSSVKSQCIVLLIVRILRFFNILIWMKTKISVSPHETVDLLGLSYPYIPIPVLPPEYSEYHQMNRNS